MDCPPRYPGERYCPAEKFQCDNHLCVEMRDLCDGSNDCYDNSDERESLCSKYQQGYIYTDQTVLTNFFERQLTVYLKNDIEKLWNHIGSYINELVYPSLNS